VRVHVGFAAEVLNEVDDDFHATGVGDVELFGPDADGDLLEPGAREDRHVFAFELEHRVADVDAVGGDRRGEQVHRR